AGRRGDDQRGIRRVAARSVSRRRLDDADRAGRYAGPRRRAAVSNRAHRRLAADGRARLRAAAAPQRAAGRRLGRAPRRAAALHRRTADAHPEPALLRRDPAHLRRPGTAGDAARRHRVDAAARVRSRVVVECDRRARQGRTALVGPRRRVMTRTYALVVALEAATIVALWLLGRIFA